MGPGRHMPYPPRIWTVDVRARGGVVTAECRSCGPVRGQGTHPDTVRRSVISHLAGHARRDLTPAHLRTCQCGRRGCPWHGRTRGCSGPILLALVWSPGAGTWRLGDLCHQCCATMPYAAPVPHHTPAVTTGRHYPAAIRSADAGEEQSLVWETACPSCSTQDGTCDGACLP